MNEQTEWKGRVIGLAESVAYADDAVVSKTILDKKTGTLTLFAFDKGQGLSEHTSPYDATVQVLDGVASIKVGDCKHSVKAGKMIIMPSGVSHSLYAEEKFKMLLIMIR